MTLGFYATAAPALLAARYRAPTLFAIRLLPDGDVTPVGHSRQLGPVWQSGTLAMPD